MKFNLGNFREGMVLHVRSNKGWIGRTIRKVLSINGLLPVWGNHDAIVILFKGRWYFGESAPLHAKLTTTEEYESRINAGDFEVKMYDVKGATPKQRKAASQYWLSSVLGTFYDFLAFPRLFFKAILGNIFKGDVGWEWAHWCTEGVADAWEKGAGLYVWRKDNPTPWTTEKRVGVSLVDVTSNIIMEER